MENLRKVTFKIPAEKYDLIEQISEKTDESVSEVIRNLIDRGLEERVFEENTNLIATIVRQQIDLAMKTHVERLASLSSKSGHMSATAAFLNVQALMDLVPSERKRDVREMYESARKKAVEYMRHKTTEDLY